MTIPRLSNWLTVQAGAVAGELAAYKRSSRQAAGVESRTARDMMTLARSRLTASQVHRHGGVRGALEALREAASDALDAGDVEKEKPATVAGFSPPAEAPVEGLLTGVEPRGGAAAVACPA